MRQLKFGLIVKVNDIMAVGVTTGFNKLYEINIETGQSNFICNFKDENILEPMLFSAGCCIKDTVYFAPRAANFIWKYNIKNKEIYKIELPKGIIGRYKFFDIINIGNKCYLFSTSELKVFELDLESESVKIIAHQQQRINGIRFRMGIFVNKSYFYCSTKDNELVEYNIVDNKFYIHSMGEDFRGAFDLDRYNNKLVIAPRYCGDPFVIYDIESKKTTNITDPFVDIKNDNYAYLNCKIVGNCIYALADYDLDSVIINLETGDSKIINKLSKNKNEKMGIYNRFDEFVIVGFQDKDKSYYYDSVVLKKYYYSTNLCEKFMFYENDNIEKKELNEGITLVQENIEVTVKDFIEYVKEQ